jgi:aconitate hydratase
MLIPNSASRRNTGSATPNEEWSNLEKQGLLALTFAQPSDNDLVAADDRVSLLGLRELATGKPVQCRLLRPDGSAETIWLNHSYSEPQLDWFRAGSALNLAYGSFALQRR